MSIDTSTTEDPQTYEKAGVGGIRFSTAQEIKRYVYTIHFTLKLGPSSRPPGMTCFAKSGEIKGRKEASNHKPHFRYAKRLIGVISFHDMRNVGFHWVFAGV